MISNIQIICGVQQRLEQPEACPREYYNIMLKCWQHDALKRPKFDDLMNILPEVCISKGIMESSRTD